MTETAELPQIPWSLDRGLLSGIPAALVEELRDRQLKAAIAAKTVATAERQAALARLDALGSNADQLTRSETKQQVELAARRIYATDIALVRVANERGDAEADRFEREADVSDEIRATAAKLIELLTYRDQRQSLASIMRKLAEAPFGERTVLPAVRTAPTPATTNIARFLDDALDL